MGIDVLIRVCLISSWFYVFARSNYLILYIRLMYLTKGL